MPPRTMPFSPSTRTRPLVGAAVAIVRAALLVAGLDDHHGALAAGVADGYAEAFAEVEGLLFHDGLARCVGPELNACLWRDNLDGNRASIRVRSSGRVDR